MLLRPRPDRYRSGHPTAADVLLLVEVADSSLAYDRGPKLALYARHGVPEVWMVDLVGRAVEICREPGPGATLSAAGSAKGWRRRHWCRGWRSSWPEPGADPASLNPLTRRRSPPSVLIQPPPARLEPAQILAKQRVSVTANQVSLCRAPMGSINGLQSCK